MKKLFSLLICCAIAHLSLSQSPFFIENQGQIEDQFGNSRNDISFKIDLAEFSVYIVDNGFDIIKSDHVDEQNVLLSRVEYRFPDFRATSISGFNQMIYSETYCTKERVINANSFEGISAIDYNSGTQIKFYSNEDGFKYDIILSPENKQSSFPVDINGAETSLIEGNIKITHPNFELIESMPLVYHLRGEKKETTEAFYALTSTGYNINFQKKNHAPLIIDPFLTYATYYGGSVVDEIRAVDADQFGNYYFAGITSSSNNIATTGAYQTVSSIYGNFFLAKFNDENQRIWGTYFQSSYPNPVDIQADSIGNIYLAGITGSGDNMGTPGTHQTFFGGDYNDCFIIKFDENGFPIWSTLYGGNGNDILNQMILVDEHIYMAGYTTSDSLIATPGALQENKTATGFFNDGYLAKFDTSGQLMVATYLGGTNSDAVDGISYHDNSLFIAGNFSSSGSGTPGTYLTNKTSNSDLYFARFDASLNRIWGSYFTGNSHVQSRHRIAARNDKIAIGFYVSTSAGNTAYATNGTHQDTALEGQSLCLLQFDTSGTNYEWGTYFDGNNWEILTDIFYPNDSTIIMCGSTYSDSAIATNNVFKPYNSTPGEHDVFVSAFNQFGQQKWGSYYGGEEEDYPLDAKIDQNNHLLIGGKTKSISGIPYGQAFQGNPYTNLYFNGFFCKFDIDRDSIFTDYNNILPNQVCPKEFVTIEYQTHGTYHPDNVFQLHLSDESGSFTNPTILASQNGTTSGSFDTQIPYLVTGGNYEFKVVSTSPEVYSNATDQMTILSSPETNFNYQIGINDVYFTDASISASTWNWDFSTGDFSADQNPTYTFASAGTYPVTLISDNGVCSDTAIHNVQINEVLGLNEGSFSVSVYPNPTADQWILSVGSKIKQYEIYDTQGKLIQSKSINTNSDIISLKASGTYILVLLDDENNLIKTIELVKS